MYARSTTMRGNRESMDAAIAYVRDTVMPALRQKNGCMGLSMLCDRDTGRCIMTTSWADAAAMRGSSDSVQPMRHGVAQLMGGEADVQEWEIALVHRKHETHNGAVARVIRGQHEPAETDRMLDAFRVRLMPQLEELPGFCSVSVLVDRASGRSATAVSYDSPLSMAESEGLGMAMRQEFADETGMQITEVEDFDVALAHLRVPETV